MTCPAGSEWTKEASVDVLVANVLAKLAVSWFFSCHFNSTPIAMIASVLHLVAHFSDLFFP